MLLLSSADVFQKFIQENYQSVKQLGSRSGPGVGPICLQRLSTDDKCCQIRIPMVYSHSYHSEVAYLLKWTQILTQGMPAPYSVHIDSADSSCSCWW